MGTCQLNLVLLTVTGLGLSAASAQLPTGQSFVSRDSLTEARDKKPDALACLRNLQWLNAEFTIDVTKAEDTDADAIIRFPSARPGRHAVANQVVLEWFAARDERGEPIKAPAVVVVHESGRAMTVGRLIARRLRLRGLHTFMIQLPYYGLRRPKGVSTDELLFATVMRQGVADIRRSYDAVKALPFVNTSQISLQGTSLGGFLAATVSGIDSVWQQTFILLAGGDLPKLLMTGQRETARLRERLERQGFRGQQLEDLLYQFEPNRLAHRIPPERLWLFSARYDTTVPPAHADSFAEAASLPDKHHVRLPATHYSGVILLPAVLDRIASEVGGRPLSTIRPKQ